jgi:nitroreductase
MGVFEAIRRRRSVRDYTDRVPERKVVTELLELAVRAPNHRLTEPWGFLVLGPEARRVYGEIRGARRAGKVEDPDTAETLRRRSVEDAVGLPLLIGVTQRLAEDPEVRREDYAATFMAVQNLLLGAVAVGLGTYVKTGAVMEDARLRDALGLGTEERLVALVQLGEPAGRAPLRPRTPAARLTRWLP